MPDSLSEFRVKYAPAIARAFARSGASRWSIALDTFAETLYAAASANTRTGSPVEVMAFLDSLRLDDLALAAGCRAGVNAAWNYFVERYRPILYASARAIARDEAPARDLADSLYAELYGLEVREGRRRSLLDYFHGRSSLGTWLRAVMAQRYVDQLRESQRSEPLGDREPHSDAIESDPPASSEARYLEVVTVALQGALAALSPRDRTRLSYYYRHGLRLKEIGRIMGESESSVSRHLDRTRRELKVAIDRVLAGEHRLSPEQIQLCYDYACKAMPLDLARVLPEGK